MTPEQERALLKATELGLEDELRSVFADVKRRILAGEGPRDVVQEALTRFTGEYASLLRTAFTAILAQSVTSEYVLNLEIGGLKLSQKLYLMGVGVSENVQSVVDRHLRGFSQARSLAFQIYEGYGFNAIEPLVFNPRNEKLPKYLREALLPDPDTRTALARAFARIQVANLSTSALQAAYQGVLDALEDVKGGPGSRYLEKKMEVAFYERMRYFSNRIAQTELHRAYMGSRGREILEDETTEFVRFDLNSGHPKEDVCDYFASVNAFGLGAGIYPKRLAPVPPIHPWCLCTLSPRPSLTGRRFEYREGVDQEFLRSLDPKIAARIAGSQAKRDQVLGGSSIIDVHNSPIDPLYRVRLAGDLT